jgi:hypothetical protein
MPSMGESADACRRDSMTSFNRFFALARTPSRAIDRRPSYPALSAKSSTRFVIEASAWASTAVETAVHRPVPVDEVGIEAESRAWSVALGPQIGPEDGFDAGVVEKVGVLRLDDLLSLAAMGLAGAQCSS